MTYNQINEFKDIISLFFNEETTKLGYKLLKNFLDVNKYIMFGKDYIIELKTSPSPIIIRFSIAVTGYDFHFNRNLITLFYDNYTIFNYRRDLDFVMFSNNIRRDYLIRALDLELQFTSEL